MVVLLIILGCLFTYMSVGLFLARTNRKKMAAVNSQYKYVKHTDDEQYLERVIDDDYQMAVYFMVFCWPVYYFIHSAQKISAQTYAELDPETQAQDLRWMKQQVTKAKKDADRLQVELLKQLEAQKSAEVKPKTDSENHLDLKAVVYPKELRPTFFRRGWYNPNEWYQK